ncbi:hypothetical protein LOTGIDRAFT_157027 [Lottia gigantea]|uniref:Uncharacterized protein n=1 Tax=Lottia gigantea TaxID=225164 RepID=V4B699_LOTGI|nr:hypothetical protein LOTGIDRAFT_157027 [Lottia gigantea]ESP03066.1 hypothetical protein LOTGIDRAFT_157027 [Lottia gigantea]
MTTLFIAFSQSVQPEISIEDTENFVDDDDEITEEDMAAEIERNQRDVEHLYKQMRKSNLKRELMESRKRLEEMKIFAFTKGKTIIPKVASFVSKNKSLISNGAKAIGSIAEAGKSISDTVKQSNELKELELIRELRNRRLEERKGKGFKVIG